jgi:hypothetical protein
MVHTIKIIMLHVGSLEQFKSMQVMVVAEECADMSTYIRTHQVGPSQQNTACSNDDRFYARKPR